MGSKRRSGDAAEEARRRLRKAAHRARKAARRAEEAGLRARREADRAVEVAQRRPVAGPQTPDPSPSAGQPSGIPLADRSGAAPGSPGANGQDLLDVMASRRSLSPSGDAAPDDAELERLLAAVVPVADHGRLRPWRLITLRGDDRMRLARAQAIAAGGDGSSPKSKALRSPLLIAIIVRHTPSRKVPIWEQEATAAGAAHLLSLALHAAGWTAFWRTGQLLEHPELRRLHGLAEDEHLRGWLHIGRLDPVRAGERAKRPEPGRMISPL